MHYADLITAITPANFHGIFRLLYLFQTLNYFGIDKVDRH